MLFNVDGVAKQCFKFGVYSSSSSKSDLRKHDFIGEMVWIVVCVMCRLVSLVILFFLGIRRLRRVWSMMVGVLLMLRQGSHLNRGVIKVLAEEVEDAKTRVRWQFSGRNLDKKDLFGKSGIGLLVC